MSAQPSRRACIPASDEELMISTLHLPTLGACLSQACESWISSNDPAFPEVVVSVFNVARVQKSHTLFGKSQVNRQRLDHSYSHDSKFGRCPPPA
ncbi:hypothetical protein BDV19DRAFT_367194 [Aspergillus venezuelensis]